MAFLIGMAYKAGDDQIEKNPNWIESECYDISARADGEGSLGNDQLRLLLQNLLSQRFHLALHREVKDFSGYGLVVAKNGPKLDATKGGPAEGNIDANGLRARNVSMALTGRYDINLSFAADLSVTSSDSSLPSVFTALQEQLGLKLLSEKVPVEMLIIDHIEMAPTEN